MNDERRAAAEAALAHAQGVLAWTRREQGGGDKAAQQLADITSQFACSYAYGATCEWEWDDLRATIPVLDVPLTATLLKPPSPRVQIEAAIAAQFSAGGVFDLCGDSLTLRLAVCGVPLVIGGEARALEVWRATLEAAVPQRDIPRIDLAQANLQAPPQVSWVRCKQPVHWFDLIQNLPKGAAPKPVVTCDAGSGSLPDGWTEAVLDGNGARTEDRENAALRLLTPP